MHELKMKDLSIVIVSWNAREYLRACLTSIWQTAGGVDLEIIVVDNASGDGSAEMVATEFPAAILVRAGSNLGFARANNLGVKHSRGRFVAFINSDVIVHPGCLRRLLEYLEHQVEVGLVGPRIHCGDGSLQHSCGQFPTVWNTGCRLLGLDRVFANLRLFTGFQMRHWDYSQTADVEVLSGCFWVARRGAMEQVGGLDERFFFYAEDVDWCKRFHSASWRVTFVADALATHYGGGSSSNAPLRFSVENLRASLIYWRKHHGNFGGCIFYFLALTRHSVRVFVNGAVGAFAGRHHDAARSKFREDVVCLRWLLTGKDVR